jgi:hypothetical protein
VTFSRAVSAFETSPSAARTDCWYYAIALRLPALADSQVYQVWPKVKSGPAASAARDQAPVPDSRNLERSLLMLP